MATNVVIDEMFPDEGGSSFMDVDEGQMLLNGSASNKDDSFGALMKESFSKAGTNLIHTDFDNDFGDIFDDENLS